MRTVAVQGPVFTHVAATMQEAGKWRPLAALELCTFDWPLLRR